MSAVTDLIPLADRILAAVERREWAIVIGIALMFVTLVLSRLAESKLFFPKEFTATALLGASLLGGLGAALAAGAPPVRSAMAFLACSTTAIAFWEGVAKHVAKFWCAHRRRRTRFARKFPTLVGLVAASSILLPRAGQAGEILEPGFVLTRPDGMEVVIEHRAVLLDEQDVARLDELVLELESCRRERERCDREHEKPRIDRVWVVLATIAGAFVAGYCAERQVADPARDSALP